MGLNIKNEAVHDLVRRAAHKTGQSQTSVVETALRRYLDDLDRDQRRTRAEAIVRDMQRRMAELGPPPVTIDDLYDPGTGLPT